MYFLLLLIAIVSSILMLGLICFIVGVHLGDRADLNSAPSGPSSRFARRVAGLHVLSPHSLAVEEDYDYYAG